MPFSQPFKSNWINEKIDADAVRFAEGFGEYLCDLNNGRPGRAALTTSQIRNFFGEIKRIQGKGFDEERTAFLLIRPKLAYAEARIKAKSGNTRMTDFRGIMEKAHAQVSTKQQFRNFVDFLEAILAYHKVHGGRD